MAHRILGIDLGSFSVKVAELEAGFRTSQVVGYYERRLSEPLPDEDDLARGARTLAELMAEHELRPEMCAASMRGEAVLRLITLPFSDPKKIEQVLGYELESQILGEIDELVLDHVIASTQTLGEAQTTHVIAVAAQRAQVRALVEALAQVDADPRVVGAAALSYGALHGRAFPSNGPPVAVIDVGHRHTQVCVTQGGAVRFARAIQRGGRDVTLAIMDGFKMDEPQAERAKHDQAFLLATGAAPESPSHRRVDQVVREAVRPLVRDLRQTLAACRAGGEPAPERLLLTGGGARLRGLLQHLEEQLGVPVEPLQLNSRALGETLTEEGKGLAAGPRGDPAACAQALGMALAAAEPAPQVNLRRGELTYRSDYSFLRGKAVNLALALLAVLVFAAVNAYASLRSLRKEAEALEGRLKRETMQTFGVQRLDGKAISDELRAGPKGGAPPIPVLTAYDVLDEISRHVPPPGKGKLDVLELDIKPKKIFIKATAESAHQVDELATALEEIECFEEVQKGKLSSVTAPASGDSDSTEKSELKQFTLNIVTTCP